MRPSRCEYSTEGIAESLALELLAHNKNHEFSTCEYVKNYVRVIWGPFISAVWKCTLSNYNFLNPHHFLRPIFINNPFSKRSKSSCTKQAPWIMIVLNILRVKYLLILRELAPPSGWSRSSMLWEGLLPLILSLCSTFTVAI